MDNKNTQNSLTPELNKGNVSKRLNLSKKDYNEYALLWNVFTFLTNPYINTSTTIVEEYINSYGLQSEKALHVAKKEMVDFRGYIDVC